MYVIFEDYLFMTYNFVNLIIGFSLIAISLFVYFVRKHMGKKEYSAFFVLAFAVGFLFYKAPLFIDVPDYKNQQYIEHIGILSSSEVGERKKLFSRGRIVHYTTTITVGNETFKIQESHSYLSNYLGKEVKIHYLPTSRYIVEITTDSKVNIPNN